MVDIIFDSQLPEYKLERLLLAEAFFYPNDGQSWPTIMLTNIKIQFLSYIIIKVLLSSSNDIISNELANRCHRIHMQKGEKCRTLSEQTVLLQKEHFHILT